jgi:hypothetical protein
MSLVLDDIDVDVSTTKRHHSCSSVYGVLVLSNLYSSIKFIWSHLITSKVVEVQPIGLAALTRNNAHTSDICTLEDVGG